MKCSFERNAFLIQLKKHWKSIKTHLSVRRNKHIGIRMKSQKILLKEVSRFFQEDKMIYFLSIRSTRCWGSPFTING